MSSLLLRSWIFSIGWVMPTRYLNSVRILLSSRLTLSCLMQFWSDEPQVSMGWFGTNNNESMAPSINCSNLYRIFLFSKSHRTTLPAASEVAMVDCSSQKAMQIAGSFSLTLKTISSFFKLKIRISPFERDKAMMLTSLEASAVIIYKEFYFRYFLRIGYSYNVFCESGFTSTMHDSLKSTSLLM